MIEDMTNDNVIETTLLRGRVRLLQPKNGFHASIDSVFLGAAVPAKKGWKILDVGCGVGSAGFCVLAREPGTHLSGIDIQQELVDLAHQNAALNAASDRCRFFAGDLRHEKSVPENFFNIVIMNPPYHETGKHTPSPQKIKALSHGEDASGAALHDWIKYAHRKLKQGGYLVLVHRADRLDQIVILLEQRRWFGSLEIFPLWPHAGENAKRVIIRARKERYAPLILKHGMVIHEKTGKYTSGARRILDAAEELDFS